jgi:hypothetical protein
MDLVETDDLADYLRKSMAEKIPSALFVILAKSDIEFSHVQRVVLQLNKIDGLKYKLRLLNEYKKEQ